MLWITSSCRFAVELELEKCAYVHGIVELLIHNCFICVFSEIFSIPFTLNRIKHSFWFNWVLLWFHVSVYLKLAPNFFIWNGTPKNYFRTCSIWSHMVRNFSVYIWIYIWSWPFLCCRMSKWHLFPAFPCLQMQCHLPSSVDLVLRTSWGGASIFIWPPFNIMFLSFNFMIFLCKSISYEKIFSFNWLSCLKLENNVIRY